MLFPVGWLMHFHQVRPRRGGDPISPTSALAHPGMLGEDVFHPMLCSVPNSESSNGLLVIFDLHLHTTLLLHLYLLPHNLPTGTSNAVPTAWKRRLQPSPPCLATDVSAEGTELPIINLSS